MKSTDTKIGAQNQSKQLRISNLCCHYPALPFSPCKNQTWFIHNPLKFPAFFPVIHSNPIIPLDQPSTSWHPGWITKGRIHPLKSIYQPGWNEYPGFPGETDQRRCKISPWTCTIFSTWNSPTKGPGPKQCQVTWECRLLRFPGSPRIWRRESWKQECFFDADIKKYIYIYIHNTYHI